MMEPQEVFGAAPQRGRPGTASKSAQDTRCCSRQDLKGGKKSQKTAQGMSSSLDKGVLISVRGRMGTALARGMSRGCLPAGPEPAPNLGDGPCGTTRGRGGHAPTLDRL